MMRRQAQVKRPHLIPNTDFRLFLKMAWVSIFFLVAASQLVGCISIQSPTTAVKPDDPNYAPVPSESLQPPPGKPGSIFSENAGLSLYGDKKARRVGDIITVILDERTVSSKSAETSSSKTSEANLLNPIIGGGGTSIAGRSIDATIDGDRSFTGIGESDQSNRLLGSITVTVSEILPNGILKVRGEKWMTLNQGDEYIRIQGLLRPEDILLDNTVTSQKLADARISYSGTGTLADSNTQGWLSKFFNSKWFPF